MKLRWLMLDEERFCEKWSDILRMNVGGLHEWMWCIWMIVGDRRPLLGGTRVVRPSSQSLGHCFNWNSGCHHTLYFLIPIIWKHPFLFQYYLRFGYPIESILIWVLKCVVLLNSACINVTTNLECVHVWVSHVHPQHFLDLSQVLIHVNVSKC